MSIHGLLTDVGYQGNYQKKVTTENAWRAISAQIQCKLLVIASLSCFTLFFLRTYLIPESMHTIFCHFSHPHVAGPRLYTLPLGKQELKELRKYTQNLGIPREVESGSRFIHTWSQYLSSLTMFLLLLVSQLLSEPQSKSSLPRCVLHLPVWPTGLALTICIGWRSAEWLLRRHTSRFLSGSHMGRHW